MCIESCKWLAKILLIVWLVSELTVSPVHSWIPESVKNVKFVWRFRWIWEYCQHYSPKMIDYAHFNRILWLELISFPSLHLTPKIMTLAVYDEACIGPESASLLVPLEMEHELSMLL